ncbi:MAG TPA: hypothetical protein VFT96_11485 [Gemmatimonadaceae bacterium]|nr:hypothetical protein [Gemmatimonadaceae bacterium]
MSELDNKIDEIVRGLVRDVAAGVHGLYRGDTRQQTTQLRLSTFGKEAGDKLRAAIRSQYGTPASLGAVATPVAGVPLPPPGADAPRAALSEEEIGALTRCVMAWLPLGGAPNAATPDMKCVSGAREMSPTWGDRETARTALRRIASP